MAKLSPQTREIIKTIIFVVVLGILLIVFVIYPLNKTKDLRGRTDLDNYSEDSVVVNDPGAFSQTGLLVDTFLVESDGLTTIAALYAPQPDTQKLIQGTVVLLHRDGHTRDSIIDLAHAYYDSGFVVVAYDQRASGRSTGKYRGDGYYESADLDNVISYMEIRGQIVHPLIVVGFGIGAEAALLAAHEEVRIDAVVACEPYLSSQRMQDILRERHQTYWFPFHRTVMWFWYDIRSGYAAPYRKIDQIHPVTRPTLILVEPHHLEDAEVKRIQEISKPGMLRVERVPDSPEALRALLIDIVLQFSQPAETGVSD